MRAVAYRESLAIAEPESLVDVELPDPEPKGRDLLVAVKAVSVNPVDTKVRRRVSPEGGWKVLGWDAAGTVVATGPEATLFKSGDAVFYAGSIDRPGTNSELHLVDERIVGHKPASLSFAEAAALPLTSITAWEGLFDRLDVKGKPVPGAAPAILVIGGAGGVGSIAVQLARRLTSLTVIATASRPETREWVTALGAHHVVDHSRPLAAEVAALGLGAPAFVFSTTNTMTHLPEIEALIAPQGRFVLIDDLTGFDFSPLLRKSVSVHGEWMYTRPVYQTADMAEQGVLLNAVARLVDEGTIRTTLTEVFGTIDAANLRRAHALIESGTARGKIVLEGF